MVRTGGGGEHCIQGFVPFTGRTTFTCLGRSSQEARPKSLQHEADHQGLRRYDFRGLAPTCPKPPKGAISLVLLTPFQPVPPLKPGDGWAGPGPSCFAGADESKLIKCSCLVIGL